MKKLLYIGLGLFLLSPFTAFAAITHDVNGCANGETTCVATTAISASWSTTDSQLDSMEIVACGAANPKTIASATDSGVAMTLLKTSTNEVGAGAIGYFYYFVPTTTVQHFTCTASATSANLQGYSSSYLGTASAPDSSNAGSGLGSTMTSTTTVNAATSWTVTIFMNGAGMATGGTNCTFRSNTGALAMGQCDSNAAIGSTGVSSATATISSAGWGFVSASIPIPSAPTSPPIGPSIFIIFQSLLLMGGSLLVK